ncbi:MAG: IS30 family transposase [Gammaproteobacteria bacterium]|nr:IS30 family transposase [Gammaproteobacteria bacterium]
MIWSVYSPTTPYAEERRQAKHRPLKLTVEVVAFIREKLLEDWSPEQISGYAKRHGLFSISHEWIYQFILQDKHKGDLLYQHLRHQHKTYRKRYGSPKRQGAIKNRVMIDERPEIVEAKQRLGDWEVDTIIGKQHKQAVVSLVDRVSKRTLLKKVSHKTAQSVACSIIEALQPLSCHVLTMTSDNGCEFAYHEKICQALACDFYFSHPYSSWERGLNENTNGLVRQYLKKGTDFTHVTDDLLMQIMEKLNNRPRKTLGYLTPEEMWHNQK